MKTLNDIYNSLFFLLQVIEITNRKITNMIIDNYRLRVFFPSFSHMKKKRKQNIPEWRIGMCFVINQYCHFDRINEKYMKIKDYRTDELIKSKINNSKNLFCY